MTNIDEPKPRAYIRVPYSILSVFVFLIFQTIGAIWWAATQTANMSFVKDTLLKMQSGIEAGYRASDATRDWSLNDKRISKIESDLEALKSQVYYKGKESAK